MVIHPITCAHIPCYRLPRESVVQAIQQLISKIVLTINKYQQQFRCAMCLILIIYLYCYSPSSTNKLKLLSSGTAFRHKDTQFQTFSFQQVKKIPTTTVTMQAANNYSGKSLRLHLFLTRNFYLRPKLTIIALFSRVCYGMSITKSSEFSFQEFKSELF